MDFSVLVTELTEVRGVSELRHPFTKDSDLPLDTSVDILKGSLSLYKHH